MKLLYSHLSPRPVDPTLRMSLLLLHSFHSHCPSTALILFSAQTDRIACLWPPALTSILHTAAICTPIVTHTHAHAIYHPPSHRVLCPNAIAWFSRTAAVYTYLLLLGRVALVPACRLGSVEQDAACSGCWRSSPFSATGSPSPRQGSDGVSPSLWCFPHFTVLITDISVHVCDG